MRMRAIHLVAAALAVLLTLSPMPARACMGYNFVEGIAYNPSASQITDDVLVLDVAFDKSLDVGAGAMDHLIVTATVRRALQGNYEGTTIRVGIGGSDCYWPFVFGREGVVAGRLITPEQGQATLRPRTVTIMGQITTLTIKWPFEETVFAPLTETVDDRRARTGETLEAPF
ncbi:MAG TPA: hypothetical protein VG841_08100 [Caulobacterales bacterium]|nr:hypothetical protein [Caulobacterales bacterium]